MRNREDGWRWCDQCQGFYRHTATMTVSAAGVCPVPPGWHDGSESGQYGLMIDDVGIAGYQDGWRVCSLCNGLWWSGLAGFCPADPAGHNAVGSAAYVLAQTPLGIGQADWRFCQKCAGMFFADHSDGVCPAGGTHDASSSGNYVLPVPVRCDYRANPDGWGFNNLWELDNTETNVLASAALAALPAAAAVLGILAGPFGVVGAVVGVAILEVRIRTSSIQYGLCGGMAFSSLDYHLAMQLLPRGGATNPTRATPEGTAVRALIWERLLDTLGAAGATFLARKLQLKFLPEFFGGGAPGLSNWTRGEVAAIAAQIQATGTPVPIGLIGESVNPMDDHQVLAYGFEHEDAQRTTLFIYDNKVANTEASILFDFSTNPFSSTLPVNGTGPDGTLRGVFRVGYTPRSSLPHAIEVVAPGLQPPDIVSAPAIHAANVSVPLTSVRCVGFSPTAALSPVITVQLPGGALFMEPLAEDATELTPMVTGEERTTGPLFEIDTAGIVHVQFAVAVQIEREGTLNNFRLVPAAPGASASVDVPL